MATRGTISIELADKTVMTVYLAQDAYITNEHNIGAGITLLNHYNTFEKCLSLVSMGAIYSLKSIVEKDETKPHESNTSDKNFRQENVCLFFNRDLGQKMETTVNDSFETYLSKTMFEDFNYIFMGGEWYLIETVVTCTTVKPILRLLKTLI